MAIAYLWISGSDKSAIATPDMESYRTEYMAIASSRRTVAGTLKTDWAAIKRRWSFAIGAMVVNDLLQFQTMVQEQDNLLWQGPDNADATYRVRVMEARWWRVSPGRYSAEMVLEEA